MVINNELLNNVKRFPIDVLNLNDKKAWRYKRLAATWRKPDGIDNKMRKQFSGYPALVKIGYGGPKLARGLHPSGFVDNLVYNVNDLSALDKNRDAARIAHTVGNKKRLDIIAKAESLGIKLLNGKKAQSKRSSSDIKNSDKKEQ